MKLLLILFLLISFDLSAQISISGHSVQHPLSLKNEIPKDPRVGTDRKHTISGTLGIFDPWLGVSYERFLTQRWGVDVAAGLIGGSVGTKFYFPKLANGKASFLVGFSEGILLSIGAKHYVPAGFTYLGENGFRFSLDLGPQIYHDTKDGVQFGLSLKLGNSF